MMTVKLGDYASVTFYNDGNMVTVSAQGGLSSHQVEQLRKILNDRAAASVAPAAPAAPEPFKPTHHFLAQGVRLLEQRDGKNLVEFSDGSTGWHNDVLILVCLVTPPYHWLGADATP